MLRNEVIEHGAMGNLVECMVHIDVNVQQICLEVIALLSIDTSAREQVYFTYLLLLCLCILVSY